jgi:hypothetical protein
MLWKEFFHKFGGCKSVSVPKKFKQRQCRVDGCNRQIPLKPKDQSCQLYILQVRLDPIMNMHSHTERNPDDLNAVLPDENAASLGKRGLPDSIKVLIDQVAKNDFLHYITVNGIFDYLHNNHSSSLGPWMEMRNGPELKKGSEIT